MRALFLCRLLGCILCFSLCLYGYIRRHNQLTELRMKLPSLLAELEEVHEQNARLAYEVGQTEHPARLMEQLCDSRFGHLHHPRRDAIHTLPLPDAP